MLSDICFTHKVASIRSNNFYFTLPFLYIESNARLFYRAERRPAKPHTAPEKAEDG
jgi:hypothetical protein